MDLNFEKICVSILRTAVGAEIPSLSPVKGGDAL